MEKFFLRSQRRTALFVAAAMSAALLSAVPVVPPLKAPTARAVATTQFVDINPDNEGPIPGQDLPPHRVGIIDCPDPCVAGRDGGRVNGLSGVPGDPNTYFAASELGGLLKTTNGGRRWFHLDGHLPTRTWDVAAASGGRTVYATSFFDGKVDSKAGIEVSQDGGSTWTKPTLEVVGPLPGPVGMVPGPTLPTVCHPARVAQPSAYGIGLRPGSNEALVGTNCGIARTVDGGAHWVRFDPTTNGVLAGNVWDVVALPGGRTYACGDDGLLFSPDGAPTTPWTVLGFPKILGIPAQAILGRPDLPINPLNEFCSLAVSPDESDVVIVMFDRMGLGEMFGTAFGGRFFEVEVTFSAGIATGVTGVSWSAIPHPDTNICGDPCRPKRRVPFVVTNDRSTVDVGAGPQPGFDLWMGEGNLVRVPCVTGNVPRCSTDMTKWSPQPDGTYTDKNGQLGTTQVHGDMGDVEFDRTLSVDACPALASSDGGVYRQVKTTSDCHGDAVFEAANAGLHAFFLWGMAGANTTGDAEHLYIGTQDNGFYASDDGGTNWDHMIGADVFDVVADPTEFVTTGEGAVLMGKPGAPGLQVAIPNSVWGAGMGPLFRFTEPIDLADGQYWIVSQGLHPSVSKGLHAIPKPNLFNFMLYVAYNNPSALEVGSWPPDANVPCAVQVAKKHHGVLQAILDAIEEVLKRVADVGLEAGVLAGRGARPYVQAGICDFVNGDQIWTYDGTNWNQLTIPAETRGGNPGFSLFAVDAVNPDRLYAAVVGDGPPRMVRSTNGGATWTTDRVLTELMHGRGAFLAEPRNAEDGIVPLPQPTMVAFDPADPNVIVAGGRESGVFLSSDAGQNWALLTDPFGTSSIPHLPRPFFAHFDDEAGTTKVYIGSTGRGVWRIELTNADMIVVKNDAPDPVVAGSDLTYTIFVLNAGLSTALNPVMEDDLPAGTTFQSVQPPPGWTCKPPTGTGGRLHCEAQQQGFAFLGSGGLQGVSQFTVVVRVNPGTPAGTVLTNTVRVVSASVDPYPANNTFTTTTLVTAAGGGLPALPERPGGGRVAVLPQGGLTGGLGGLQGGLGNLVARLDERPRRPQGRQRQRAVD